MIFCEMITQVINISPCQFLHETCYMAKNSCEKVPKFDFCQKPSESFKKKNINLGA